MGTPSSYSDLSAWKPGETGWSIEATRWWTVTVSLGGPLDALPWARIEDLRSLLGDNATDRLRGSQRSVSMTMPHPTAAMAFRDRAAASGFPVEVTYQDHYVIYHELPDGRRSLRYFDDQCAGDQPRVKQAYAEFLAQLEEMIASGVPVVRANH